VRKKTEEPKEKEAKFDYRSSRFLGLFFPAIYAVALAIICIMYSIIPGPEFLVLVFLIYAAYNNWTRRFVKDWVPFIALFLSYEAMFGIVGIIAKYNLHGGPLNLELQLFGQIPSIVLQNLCRLPLLDYMGAIFYSLHFFVPTIFAFFLWRKSPKNYWNYLIALALCTYSSLVTFLVYPVAPPWYAVPGVDRILTSSVDASLGIPVYKTVFDLLSSNQFAAFPSMHSALPWLISLFAIKVGKVKALPILIFPFGVWFSAVYLGEHYIVDVLGGIAYATFAFIVAEAVLPRLAKRSSFLKRHLPYFETESSG
jgi:membrane-associated phospholipid phosphatase